MDYCPVQRESKTFILLTMQKPEISAGSMGHLAPKGFTIAELTKARISLRDSEEMELLQGLLINKKIF